MMQNLRQGVERIGGAIAGVGVHRAIYITLPKLGAWVRQMKPEVHSQPARTCPKLVLFVHDSCEYGGAEKHLLELLKAFSASGSRLSVLFLDIDFFSERLGGNNGESVSVRHMNRPKSFWEWLRALKESRPDSVVFVSGVLWAFPWYTPVIGWLSGIPRRFLIAHLPPPPAPPRAEGWSFRSIAHRVRRRRHLLAVRLSASFYTATICVSNAIRDSLVADYHFPASKTITIHNGVALSSFDLSGSGPQAVRIRAGIRTEEFLLVCVARLSEQKAIDILLFALARVLHEGVRCKCVIVGDGPLRRQLSEQALALGLSSHVFFEGFQEDVRPYLQAADAFVLTSRKEGLPLAILEAMASGLPCIVTNVGGNAEAIIHMVNGLVVSPGSVNEVANAISYLATHPHERLEMSRMARSRVRESFDLRDRMAEIKRVILS